MYKNLYLFSQKMFSYMIYNFQYNIMHERKALANILKLIFLKLYI